MRAYVGNEIINLGLNMKYEGKGEKTLGYSRKTVRGWEYSLKASKLIGQYKSAFPDFFQYVERNIKKGISKSGVT